MRREELLRSPDAKSEQKVESEFRSTEPPQTLQDVLNLKPGTVIKWGSLPHEMFVNRQYEIHITEQNRSAIIEDLRPIYETGIELTLIGGFFGGIPQPTKALTQACIYFDLVRVIRKWSRT